MRFLKRAYTDQEAKEIFSKSENFLNELEFFITQSTKVYYNPTLRAKRLDLLKDVQVSTRKMLAILMEKKQIPSAKERVALGKVKTFLSKRSHNSDEFVMFKSVITDMTNWWKNWKDLDQSAEEGEDFFKIKDVKVRVTSKVTPDIIIQCKEIIQTTINLIDKSTLPRFKEMLNNLQIFIVAGKKTNTIAYYTFTDDFVYLQHQYIKLRGVEDSIHSLIHELGHRYLHKIASLDQKKEWKKLYKQIQSKQWSPEAEKFFPQVGDSLSRDFKIDSKQKYPMDVIKEVKYDPRFGQIIYVLESGGIVSKSGFRNYLGFPTAYCNDSEDEFFCETLALIHMKKLKPKFEDIKDKFLEIWH